MHQLHIQHALVANERSDSHNHAMETGKIMAAVVCCLVWQPPSIPA